MITDKISAPRDTILGTLLQLFYPAFAFSVPIALFWGTTFLLNGKVSHGTLGASRFWDVAIPPLWCALFFLLMALSCGNVILPTWAEELLVFGPAWFLVSFLVGIGWGIELGLIALAPTFLFFPLIGWFFCVQKLRGNRHAT